MRRSATSSDALVLGRVDLHLNAGESRWSGSVAGAATSADLVDGVEEMQMTPVSWTKALGVEVPVPAVIG